MATPFPRNVRIILVEPEFPGNIGAASRAMKTMGMSQLVLVNPQCDPQCDEANRLAHNAADVLVQARLAASLEEALADTVFSVGTTRRTRRQKYPVYTPEETASLVRQQAGEQPAAIVFGRESIGLTNPELAMCSVHSTIPAADEAQSLNLAQSVMLYTYTLFQTSLTPEVRNYQWTLATHEEMERFYKNLGETLFRWGTKPATTMDNFIERFRRVLSRVPLETRDVRLLYKLLVSEEGREEARNEDGGSRIEDG